MSDIFAHPLAEGTILEAGQVVAAPVAGVNQAVKQHLTRRMGCVMRTICAS